MRYQVWHVSAAGEKAYGLPYDAKETALGDANMLNDKPVDGTLYVVKAVPPTEDLRQAAEKLLAILDDEDATRGITGVPVSIMASQALEKMELLTLRLECDRGFNRSGFASLTEGRP